MIEQWKPVPEFPGYNVSDYGKVRSYHKFNGASRGWSVVSTPQRQLSPARDTNGYACLSLSLDGERVPFRVHQLVMLAFIGPCPDGMEICHNNGDKADDRLANLRYDTHEANCAEACLHGSRPLDPDQVLSIRIARANGASCNALAKQHGIKPHLISSICLHRVYKAIGGPMPKKYYRKLTAVQVIDIRKQLKAGDILQKFLARKYGVSISVISRIKSGKIHKSVQESR